MRMLEPDKTLPLKPLKLILHSDLPSLLSQNETPTEIRNISLQLSSSRVNFYFLQLTWNSGRCGVLLGKAGNVGASRIYVQ
jgi:hypothetical protein